MVYNIKCHFKTRQEVHGDMKINRTFFSGYYLLVPGFRCDIFSPLTLVNAINNFFFQNLTKNIPQQEIHS